MRAGSSRQRRAPPLPPWSWHGVVAAVLALTLGGGYAAVLVIEALHGTPLRGELLTFLTNLGSILAGALAGWLGGSAVADERRRLDELDDGRPELDDDGGRDTPDGAR